MNDLNSFKRTFKVPEINLEEIKLFQYFETYAVQCNSFTLIKNN